MPVFHSEQWVAAELARVFSFFSDPGNLPRLMPEASQARIERLSIVTPHGLHTSGQAVAGPGSEIEVSLRVLPPLPIRIRWLARILEYQHNVFFTDTQVKGPFKQWDHRHEFTPQERGGQPGTIIRDHVEYEVGWGVPGRLLNSAVHGQIARMFEERHLRTAQLLAS